MILTEKQKELYSMLPTATTILAEGGGRSGKTMGLVRFIFLRGFRYPKTDHLIIRYRFSHVKQSICYQTVNKLETLDKVPYNKYLNKTDWFYELPNGSRVWIGGSDDKQRVEKILGNEYATIYFNEASQISYETYETILTRLNPPRNVPAKVLIDYNPPSIMHWGYQVFHKRLFPDGRAVPESDYKYIKMNPADNPHVSDQYFKTLENMSLAKRKRFMDGEYQTDSGALWKRAWIKYDAAPHTFQRIVIGVDPSGTISGDEIGIIAAGKIGTNFWILDDYSCHGTPAEWSSEVSAAYNKWKADIVIAEKNYGGDMVQHTIQSSCSNINVRLINSSRGKIVRAEPISALYEHGRVNHRIPFMDLEDEYCIYEADNNMQSPNRLDAAVFALTELSESGGGGVSSAKLHGI
jgi:hypothetical protein